MPTLCWAFCWQWVILMNLTEIAPTIQEFKTWGAEADFEQENRK